MIAWLGTLSSISGSFMVAFGILQLGYVAFLVGSVSWLVVAAGRRDRALMLLNFVFFAANIVGIYRNFVL